MYLIIIICINILLFSDKCEFVRFTPGYNDVSRLYPCFPDGIISTCRADFNGWRLKEDCESGENAWIYHRDQKGSLLTVYKNSHCAICNMGDSITEASLEKRAQTLTDFTLEFYTRPTEDSLNARILYIPHNGNCYFNRSQITNNSLAFTESSTFEIQGVLKTDIYRLPINFGYDDGNSTSHSFHFHLICGDEHVSPFPVFETGIEGQAYVAKPFPREEYFHNQPPIKQLFGFSGISPADIRVDSEHSDDWSNVTGDTKICAKGLYRDDDNGDIYKKLRLSYQGIEVCNAVSVSSNSMVPHSLFDII